MEWGTREQVLLLLECAGMGWGMGAVVSVYLCLTPGKGKKGWRRFLFDALLGLPLAVLSFYCLLGMADGKNQWLFWLGAGGGFCLFRLAFAHPLEQTAQRIRRVLREQMRWIKRKIASFCEKYRQKRHKIPKKRKFFSKNS